MIDIGNIATRLLEFGKRFAPMVSGGAEAVEAAEKFGELVSAVLPSAPPATRAELQQLRDTILPKLDATIDSLGDRPAPRKPR